MVVVSIVSFAGCGGGGGDLNPGVMPPDAKGVVKPAGLDEIGKHMQGPEAQPKSDSNTFR